MRRGDLYRVSRPSARDPKKYRIFVVASRQVLIDSKFSTVICAVSSEDSGVGPRAECGAGHRQLTLLNKTSCTPCTP